MDAYRLLKMVGRFRVPLFFDDLSIAQHHTPKRLLNYLLANLECRMGRLRPASRPYQAVIDPSSACTLRCPICPTGSGAPGRKRCLMKLSDFKRIIDELGGCLYSAFLYNWGEPFLNPDAFEMIGYAKSKGIATFMSSNLNVRMADFGEKIVKSGLDYLYVSIDGSDEKSYAGYRRGGNYALVKSNLAEILDAKKKLGSSTPFTVAGYLVMRHNEAGIEKFKKEMKDMGVDCVYAGRILLKDYNREKGLLPLNDEFNAYSAGGKRKTPFSRCSTPWTTAVILPDLGVSACCRDFKFYEERYDVGNMRGKSFSEVWNSDEYSALRKVVRDRLPGTEIPCSGCFAGLHPNDIAIEWVGR